MPIATTTALFPADLLRDKLARFRAVSAAEIRAKQDILADWIAQLHSGKVIQFIVGNPSAAKNSYQILIIQHTLRVCDII